MWKQITTVPTYSPTDFFRSDLRVLEGLEPLSSFVPVMVQITSHEVIDLSHYPSFFLSLQVQDCWNTVGSAVQAALDDVLQKCTKGGTREHRKALYTHENPAGNLYTLSFGLCEAERLPYLVRYIDYILIIDGEGPVPNLFLFFCELTELWKMCWRTFLARSL